MSKRMPTDEESVNVALDWACAQAMQGKRINILDLAKVKECARRAHAEGRNVTKALNAFIATLTEPPIRK